MAKTPPTAVEEILSFFITALNSGKFHCGREIPRMKELAEQTGFSRVTLWKAITLLRQAEILCGVRGRRIAVAKDIKLPLTPDIMSYGNKAGRSRLKHTTSPGADRVAHLIEKDIVSGKFVRGHPLPSYKELQKQYPANYRTLRKALMQLAAKGIVHRGTRFFSVPRLTQHHKTHAIVLIAHGGNNIELTLSALNENYLFFFEQECLQAGILPRTLLYTLEDSRPVYLAGSDKRQKRFFHSRDVLGYIVFALHPDFGYQHVVHDCAASGVPIAVLDEIGDIQAPSTGFSKPLRVFPIGTSANAAEKIGHYLWMLGHRHIAYISPFHAAAWSKIRLAGLRNIFTKNSEPESVTPFTLDFLTNILDNFIEQGIQEGHGNELFAWYHDWKQHIPHTYQIKLDRFMQSIETNVFAQCIHEHIMGDLFMKALNDNTISAWVCSNDAIAIDALHFLEHHAVSVPQRVSVIGFDNERRSMNYALTTYDFSMQSVVRAMLSFLTRPNEFMRNWKSHYFESEGMIIERKTSGPPGKESG